MRTNGNRPRDGIASILAPAISLCDARVEGARKALGVGRELPACVPGDNLGGNRFSSSDAPGR